jgi:hypothetical protein
MVTLGDIIAVMQGLRGRTSDIVYDLFFGEERLVAAVVLHFSDLADIYREINATDFLFGNLGRHSQVKMRSSKLMEERRTAFQNKTLDEILASHQANLEIDYRSIVSVAVKRSLLKTSLEFIVQGNPERKIDFWLETSQIAEVEGLVKRFLPERMK